METWRSVTWASPTESGIATKPARPAACAPRTIAWADVALAFAIRWVNPLDGALGEEPGWRGFALPRLWQRWSPLVSAAGLGVLVAIWHVPLVVSGQGNPVGWVGIPTTFFVTIVYCWLFRRADGSVLITMLFHVVQGALTIGSFGFAGADETRMLWLGFAAWILVAGAVLLDRRAWRADPVEPAVLPVVLTTRVVQP